MSTWYQKFEFQPGDAEAWLSLTPSNSYRVIPPDSAPNQLPAGLLGKCDAVLVMRSGSANEEYIVANLYRRDRGMIDQMPFGCAFISGSGSAGFLTHHGNWNDRTFSGSNLPPGYYPLSAISSGLYQQNFATLGLPAQESGSINLVTPLSNIEAFWSVIQEIKRNQP